MLTSGTDILPISKARYYFRLLGWYPVTVDLALQDALLGGQDNFNEDLGYYGCVGEDTDGYTLFAVEKSGNCVIAMNSNKEFSFQDC